jgi:hypothetical protein
MRAVKPYLPALAATLVLGLGAGAAHAKDPALPALTLEHFKDSATVKETADATTVISTESGFVTHSGPMRMVWNDEFLSSVIDDKTGRRSYQVDALVIYSGAWRSYESAAYQTAGGGKSVPLVKLGKEAANCATGECTYTERIAFPVDEELLRREAAAYAPGNAPLWSFKLTPLKGPAYTGVLSSAEIAGLLARVDEYTHRLPVVKAQTTSAALKFDLGIAGMAVTAPEDHPNRAGVLITGVDRGSVAQKSGIIIGDIVYEFAGRPVLAPADLQAAVAASAANTAVTVKVFRGITPTTLTAQF